MYGADRVNFQSIADDAYSLSKFGESQSTLGPQVRRTRTMVCAGLQAFGMAEDLHTPTCSSTNSIGFHHRTFQFNQRCECVQSCSRSPLVAHSTTLAQRSTLSRGRCTQSRSQCGVCCSWSLCGSSSSAYRSSRAGVRVSAGSASLHL